MRVFTLLIGLLFAPLSFAATDITFIKNTTSASKPALECYEVGLNNRLLKICNLYCGMTECDTKHPRVPRKQCEAYKKSYIHYARLRGSATQLPCEVYKSKPYTPHVRHRHNHTHEHRYEHTHEHK